jgi:putative DNA primase/helicase
MSSERKLVRLTEVEQKAVEWLWQGYLPAGAITDLSGDPAQAKSRGSYDLAARVTKGKPILGSSAGLPPADVVLLQAEDSVAGTVKPALVAAGGDISWVFASSRHHRQQGMGKPRLPILQ